MVELDIHSDLKRYREDVQNTPGWSLIGIPKQGWLHNIRQKTTPLVELGYYTNKFTTVLFPSLDTWKEA